MGRHFRAKLIWPIIGGSVRHYCAEFRELLPYRYKFCPYCGVSLRSRQKKETWRNKP